MNPGQMKSKLPSMRWLLMVLAVGMLPFGLDSWNAARIIGAAAAVTFIILTIAAAPERADR